jgi:hypothetical protein
VFFQQTRRILSDCDIFNTSALSELFGLKRGTMAALGNYFVSTGGSVTNYIFWSRIIFTLCFTGTRFRRFNHEGSFCAGVASRERSKFASSNYTLQKGDIFFFALSTIR